MQFDNLPNLTCYGERCVRHTTFPLWWRISLNIRI